MSNIADMKSSCFYIAKDSHKVDLTFYHNQNRIQCGRKLINEKFDVLAYCSSGSFLFSVFVH